MTDQTRTAAPAAADGGEESLLARAVDEFLAEARDGGRPLVEDYAARYPAVADDLRRVLPALALVGPSDVGSASNGAGFVHTPGNRVLGDLRILREIGRGGMGVVYEAEQLSHGRRVALKVLPFAATMDPRHLQRFKNEARAAAALHHPNVVPVYGVGCDRGVHFYAMQLIDGRPLTDLVRERRGEPVAAPAGPHETGDPAADTPSVRGRATTAASTSAVAYFRRVAELGIQAAEALEYAHAMGVVHRDVKPGNLLLDGRGNLWVADFGLAKLGADAGVTMTGDLLGTLRYLSPEQALAKHGLVDHRTDVYALGATLYELLTLRPVVDGADRQEILQRIATEEPTPPRKLDRRVPAELETVVLNCLRKEPAERYATARELAEDLRRFLNDLPVRARRPSPAYRARKWVRRNRALTALLAVVVLSVATLVAGVLWSNARLRGAADRKRQSADREREAAEAERRQAKQAARERDAARDEQRRAAQAVDDTYTRVAEEWLGRQPRLQPLQREFLEPARPGGASLPQGDRRPGDTRRGESRGPDRPV
jgi:serine/threonine protein kinase